MHFPVAYAAFAVMLIVSWPTWLFWIMPRVMPFVKRGLVDACRRCIFLQPMWPLLLIFFVADVAVLDDAFCEVAWLTPTAHPFCC